MRQLISHKSHNLFIFPSAANDGQFCVLLATKTGTTIGHFYTASVNQAQTEASNFWPQLQAQTVSDITACGVLPWHC